MSVLDLFDLSGKTAVITGSSRGIGRAIAERYAQAGANVVVSSRKMDACEEVTNAINKRGGKAISKTCNISEKKQCDELIEFAESQFSSVDILVCNAASNPYYGKLSEIPDEAFDKIMNNNVRSNLWLSQKVLPSMGNKGGGVIIIVSSIAGLQGVENLGAYSISKTADLGLVRSLAVEWGGKGVRVNALCPGIIKTDFARALWENPNIMENVKSTYPLGRIGTTDEVAGAALMLAGPAGGFITGQAIVMDGGVTISGKG